MDSKPVNTFFCIDLKVKRRDLFVVAVKEHLGTEPQGEYLPQEGLQKALIGHWCEVISYDNEVLYRDFIHNKLPLYPATHMYRSGRKRQNHRICLILPSLARAAAVCVFEQSYLSPEDKHPVKTEHLRINLNAVLFQKRCIGK
ncbi:MAG: hypothetical protein ACI9Y1_001677 [Lentisphaeria bacterium]|jgi:hypothetical protein